MNGLRKKILMELDGLEILKQKNLLLSLIYLANYLVNHKSGLKKIHKFVQAEAKFRVAGDNFIFKF